MPDAQIHQTGKHINDVLRGFRNIGLHRAGLIVLTVEVAAGRLVTHDGLPSRSEVAAMTHSSGKLARGQFGLTRAQRDVVEGLREGYAYRHVPIELESDWRRRARWEAIDFAGVTDAQLAQAVTFLFGEKLPNLTFNSITPPDAT